MKKCNCVATAGEFPPSRTNSLQQTPPRPSRLESDNLHERDKSSALGNVPPCQATAAAPVITFLVLAGCLQYDSVIVSTPAVSSLVVHKRLWSSNNVSNWNFTLRKCSLKCNWSSTNRPAVHLLVLPPSFLVHCTNLLLCLCPGWAGGE